MAKENALRKHVNILEEIDAIRDQLAMLAFDAFMLEAAEAAELAVQVFGTRDRAAHWFARRSEALGNKSPLMLACESKDEVETIVEELNTIKYGNWA